MKTDMRTTEQRIEQRTRMLLSLAVFAGIVAVAYADSLVEAISLGYLYLLPLALAALVFRLRVSLVLAFLCMVLHDVLGPFTEVGWLQFTRNLFTFVGFCAVILMMNRVATQRRALNEIVRRQRDELRHEIERAAKVQQRMLPAAPPAIPGYDFAGSMIPARTIGGDYFDYIEQAAGKTGLVIADVSGKGLAAALLMASVEMALRMDAPSQLEVEGVMRSLNQVLCDVTDAESYVTLFYARLDAAHRTLQYSNAGHMPPLLLRAASKEPQWLEEGGTVLGLVPEANYDNAQIVLAPGDTLVLYTDGVTEASGMDGKEFSRERLLEAVRADSFGSAQAILEALRKRVFEFHGSRDFEDDLTILVLHVMDDSVKQAA